MKPGGRVAPDDSPRTVVTGVGLWADCQRMAISLRRRGLGRLALDLALEVLLVYSVIKGYNIVRNHFGSVAVPPAQAHEHALKVIDFEKALWLFHEQQIQHFFMRWPEFVRFWNIYYWVAHGSNTFGVLLALFFLRPALYQRARSALLLMNCLAIIGYATFPLMPPRLVPDCDTGLGGCDPSYSFVDTMDAIGSWGSWRNSELSKVSNHYAAMPSMHFGYALWVCTALAALVRGGPFHPRPLWAQRLLLGLIGLYPASVLFCIVVTANHYFLDAICGGAVVGISYVIAAHVPEFGRGAARDWGPTLYWVTGPNSSIVAVADRQSRESGDSEGLPLLSPNAPKSGWASAAASNSILDPQGLIAARDEAVVLERGRPGGWFDSASSLTLEQKSCISSSGSSGSIGGGGGSNRSRTVQLMPL